MYSWIVFVHVMVAFTFAMAHGASANVAFRLRRETARERISALLDLSMSYANLMYLSLLAMLVSGVLLGFQGGWWGEGWIWLALGLMLVKLFAMWGMASRPLGRLREMVALPSADAAEISQRAAALKPAPIALVGFGGLALIVGLMMFKPF